MKTLEEHASTFLRSFEGKTGRTYRQYAEGIEPLLNFVTNYDVDNDVDPNIKNTKDITPMIVDHVLGYFVIRKYLAGDSFLIHTARATKAFFNFLAKEDVYDQDQAKEITMIANHYLKQYPRISKLGHILWDSVEGEIDRVMQIAPPAKREKEIQKLRKRAKNAHLKEPGYTTVIKIKADVIFGESMEGEKIGPVSLDRKCIDLVKVGDIINMITIRKLKGKTTWEIAELGYIYPPPFYESDDL